MLPAIALVPCSPRCSSRSGAGRHAELFWVSRCATADLHTSLENRTALWPFFPFRGAHVASDKPCLPQAASFLREEKGCSRISAAWVMKWRRRHGGKIREFQTPPSHSLAPCFSLNLKEKNVIQNSFHKSQL